MNNSNLKSAWLVAGVAAASAIIPEQTQAQVPTAWDAMQYFQYNINGVSVNPDPATGRRVVSVLFTVTDPSRGGVPWNIKTDVPFVQAASLSRVAVDIGWTTADYNNTGAANETLLPIPWGGGVGAALPISVDALRRSIVVGNNYLVQAPLPWQAVGSGTVALEGRVAWPVEVNGQMVFGRVPVKSAYRHFSITDPIAMPRREIVTFAKCQVCHDGGVHQSDDDGAPGTIEIPRLSLHGNNRTEELHVCAICHNPNQTDIGYRRFGAEESVDFKRMIHAIHGTKRRQTPYIVIGFGGSTNDFSDIRFPGQVADCLTCHVDINGRGTFELPLAPSVRGSTIVTRGIPGSLVDVDPANDLKITPIAAVCSSCHDSTKARSHMTATRQGGAFGVLQSDIDSGRVRERCVDCHGRGRDKDVRKVHQIVGD